MTIYPFKKYINIADLNELKDFHFWKEFTKNQFQMIFIAAQVAGLAMGQKLRSLNIRTIRVRISGFNAGRIASLKGITQAGEDLFETKKQKKISHKCKKLLQTYFVWKAWASGGGGKGAFAPPPGRPKIVCFWTFLGENSMFLVFF